MKPTNPDPATTDRRFDHALQSRYRHAAENVSVRTQAQLRIRLNAAMAPPESLHARRTAWRLAALFSLALATVVGLQLRTPEPAAPAKVAANANADNGDLLASLDEAPDLYLWLASDDASSLVSE